MAPAIPMCIPVLLSVLADQIPDTTGNSGPPKTMTDRLMSVYLPRYNTRCDTVTENTLCYDSVIQNFLRCDAGMWKKVYIDRQIPVILPTDERDIAIRKLTEKLDTLEQRVARSNRDLLHRISSPWCEGEGWQLHGYQCYLNTISSQELLSWSDARNFCKNQDAELVTIENAAENEFVGSLTRDSTSWIGMRVGDDGGRQWIEDTGSQYENFGGVPQRNSCIYMDGIGGLWHSIDCTQQMTFSCQKTCCGLS